MRQRKGDKADVTAMSVSSGGSSTGSAFHDASDPDADLFGRPKTPGAHAREAEDRRDAARARAAETRAVELKYAPRDAPFDDGPAASHADLLTRIRQATEGLAKLTEGLD